MSEYKIKKKFDNVWIGTVIGLSAPLFTLFVFYLVRYNHLTFGEFYTKILLANGILTSSISLCVIINLLIFFLFIWSNRNYSARGVLLATIVYAGYVLYQKNIK
ncbi:MAG: hypothetical protein HY841_13210 [Bacteroidetes bacterium]|nr:hypothetical protein [Bacteroidota bacterium]